MIEFISRNPGMSGWGLLTLFTLLGPLSGGRLKPPVYLRYLWTFFLMFAIGEWIGYGVAVWVLAAFSFVALREYFSLVDFRLQDRWALLVAYLTIPFMMLLIRDDWYGLFIVSIPVYAFQVIPFLVAAGGGERDGMVFSIGAIDLGLLLFVFSVGHIAYLAKLAPPLAMVLVLGVATCDLVSHLLRQRLSGGPAHYLARLVISAIPTMALTVLTANRAGLTLPVAGGLGMLIPLLVIMGHFTISAVEVDLGIEADDLLVGRGRIIDSTRSYLFTAPIVFHYLRYLTEIF